MATSASARRAVTVTVDGSARSYSDAGQSITFVPLAIKRRHNRKVLTPPPGSPSVFGAPATDIPMVKLLGKAFYWQRMIDEGVFDSGNALARRYKLEPGWVAEILRLTLLAPDIVEAILDGRQPRHVHLHLIKGRLGDLPREWDRQRAMLGFTAAHAGHTTHAER